MTKCECCEKKAKAVVSCIAVPYSAAICATCLAYGAQPAWVVAYVFDACGGKEHVDPAYLDHVTVWSLEEGYQPARKWEVPPGLLPEAPPLEIQ